MKWISHFILNERFSRSVIRLLGSIALDMPIDLCSYFMLPESVVRKACHRIFFQRSVITTQI
uniref:Uncharacterized protein n=1 Tax=Wuchereria bancrofti TaxID=6293 RepID=A0AAF5RWP2_WUCBA